MSIGNPNELNWQPLESLGPQRLANVAALKTRNEPLAQQLLDLLPANRYCIAASEDQVVLAQFNSPTDVQLLPNPVTPTSAMEIAVKLYPSGKCAEPVLVAGLDQGWLWGALFDLEISTPSAPGHRPPLYFLASSIERLWVVMHFQNWTNLLSDSRTQLFVGVDAFDQMRQSMIENHTTPWPKFSVTIEPAIWPAGQSIDTLLRSVNDDVMNRFKRVQKQLEIDYAMQSPAAIADRIAGGQPLRILGITSRFTTFLQYSMRDWLASCEAMGHQTKLVIEQDDSELANQLIHAEACAQFKPDVVVMIDHYRAEMRGVPNNVPFVMWVQDYLPNIFNAKAGANQGALDYTIGHGRLDCMTKHQYPASRFMPTIVGFNEKRFATRTITAEESQQFGCDVSFVSHASTPPEQLIADEVARSGTPDAKRFLTDLYERMKAIYDAGNSISALPKLDALLSESMAATGVSTEDSSGLLNFVSHKLNNSFFRHQALHWLGEMGVDLHIYGRGWEKHPTLGKFARGVADNERQLSAIYQSSKINLQVQPFGAAHQRVFDGLSAGGFFLMRHCDGDRAEQLYKAVWESCQRYDIQNDDELRSRMDDQVRGYFTEIVALVGSHPLEQNYDFVSELSVTADEGFLRCASTIWPEYGEVSFATESELKHKVFHFLTRPNERATIVNSMRNRAVETLTYGAISRRMLKFIADDLRRHSQRAEAA